MIFLNQYLPDKKGELTMMDWSLCDSCEFADMKKGKCAKDVQDPIGPELRVSYCRKFQEKDLSILKSEE